MATKKPKDAAVNAPASDVNSFADLSGPDESVVEKVKKAAKVALHEVVKLESHFSFFDDAGQFFQWVEGFVESDIEKIKMLIERKAPIVAAPEQVKE